MGKSGYENFFGRRKRICRVWEYRVCGRNERCLVLGVIGFVR